MYCSACGVEIPDTARFCMHCGAATRNARTAAAGVPSNQKLSRPREDRKIAGVCSGVARYVGADVTLIRILFLVFAVWPPGVGLLLYLICWIVMPQDPLLLPAPPASVSPQNASVTTP